MIRAFKENQLYVTPPSAGDTEQGTLFTVVEKFNETLELWKIIMFRTYGVVYIKINSKKCTCIYMCMCTICYCALDNLIA